MCQVPGSVALCTLPLNGMLSQVQGSVALPSLPSQWYAGNGDGLGCKISNAAACQKPGHGLA